MKASKSVRSSFPGLILLAGTIGLSWLNSVAMGATNGKLSRIDSAFNIQGEYKGRIVAAEFPLMSGLQVIATGETTFDAVLLDGGLPGDGWDQKGRYIFKGSGYMRASFKTERFRLRLEYLDQYPGIIFVYNGNYRIGTMRKVYRNSPTLGLEPPERATVIYQDSENHRLKNPRFNPDGTLGVGAETEDQIQNARIHVEFRTPFEPEKSGQKRGNSGVYIQRRYEVQILDSYGLELEPNRCGGLYRQKSADINMALPPEAWQTYDIYFFAAKFDEAGKRIKRARITVVQNGVKIHDNYELVNKTGAGRKESAESGPIWFQDHGDPVQFRNLWMVALDDDEFLEMDQNPEFGFVDRPEGAENEEGSTDCLESNEMGVGYDGSFDNGSMDRGYRHHRGDWGRGDWGRGDWGRGRWTPQYYRHSNIRGY